MSNNHDKRIVGIMTEQLEEQRNNFLLEASQGALHGVTRCDKAWCHLVVTE